jgi:hypothetical protein
MPHTDWGRGPQATGHAPASLHRTQILDLDLDFFLHAATDGLGRNPATRLPDAEFPVWDQAAVRAFLEQRCGLNRTRRARGRGFEHHDEAFFCWRDRIDSGEVSAPFDLVHVDTHADLGYPYAQQESFAISLVKVCAASLSPSPQVR